MKQAIYSLLTSNDYGKCMKKLKEAYDQLKSNNYVAATSRMAADERRDNADILALMYLHMCFRSNQTGEFKKFSRAHFFSFTKTKPENHLEETKWKANWFF
jgi:hypothetical protein